MAGKSLEEMYIESQKAKTIYKATKEDKVFESYKNLRLRGVNSTSVIARTLGVSTRTVSRYKNKWNQELRESVSNINKQQEVNKLVLQLDLITSQMWTTVISENMQGKDKIQALNNLIAPLKFRAEILGIEKDSINYMAMENIHKCNPKMYAELDRRIREGNLDINKLAGVRPI